MSVFQEAKPAGLACAFVSNGNATPEALDYLRPWIAAYKIDLKGFDDKHYRELGGTLEAVTNGIRLVYERGLWLEVVTLIVPGFNDSEDELRAIAKFLASISRDIPWHVTAFHPDYKMTGPPATTARQLIRAAEIGVEAGLRFVYAGNMPGRTRQLGEHLLPGLPRTAHRAHRLPRAAIQNHRRRPMPEMPVAHPWPFLTHQSVLKASKS